MEPNLGFVMGGGGPVQKPQRRWGNWGDIWIYWCSRREFEYVKTFRP